MEKQQIENGVCPFCGSSDVAQRLVCKDALDVNKAEYAVCECRNCGIWFTDKMPEKYVWRALFESPEFVARKSGGKGWRKRFFRFVRMCQWRCKCRLVIRYTGKMKGTMLDYGARSGRFAYAMIKKGWRVDGVETDKRLKNLAIRNLGIELRPDEHISRQLDGTFDCITLWHELNRLNHLDRKFRLFSELLKDDGRLIVSLPNRDSYDAAYYGERWAEWDVPRTRWHFSPEAIQKIGEQFGFELVGVCRMPLDSYRTSVLSEYDRGSNHALLKGLWRGFLLSLRAAGGKGRGGSLVYVFKKRF